MAKNDVVLIDAILEERIKDGYPSTCVDEAFEFFAFEQVLKDFDLSYDEIEAGWVDGRDDGGIDGFFVLVNGHLLQDPAAFSWPKRNAEIEVRIFTCKHHDTFQQAPLNSLLASVPELFDLSLEKDRLRGSYSDELLQVRGILHAAYRRLSVVRPSLSFRLAYVSRGDSTHVAENIRARATQLIGVIKSLFSECGAAFEFVGASELVSLFRRTKTFSLPLPVLECVIREPRSYVALTRLDEYHRFVTDENGNLRRYLFDSNVRDYLGENPVNEDIVASLKDANAPDFWWLNNGVTILATSATVVGKMMQLQDIQIVNGLQTTESVFRYFQSGDRVSASRALLVKIIVSADLSVRDRIIRATNNQSIVELSSLRATDKIQRDIEEVLQRQDWYYERRRNYYRNIGKPPNRFVTPMYLAAGCIALVMKNPAVAAHLRSRFMRNNETYSSIFSDDLPLQAWVTVTEVLKRVEDGLSQVRPVGMGESQRFLANWRNLVALLAVARVLGRFSYSIADLVEMDVTRITSTLVIEMWRAVESLRGTPSKARDFRSAKFVADCCAATAAACGLNDPEAVGRQGPVYPIPTRRPKPIPTEDLIQKVDARLPSQPWKQGVHALVAAELGCKPFLVSAAIEELVRRGIRLYQKDGVVYDANGKIIAVDEERVKSGEFSRNPDC